MVEISSHSCVRFIPRTKQTSYLRIYAGDGCYSMVGRVGGEQGVSLGKGCDFVEIIIHELMHALGFWHEQSRPDRDNYVIINWQNIQPSETDQFKTNDPIVVDTLGQGYDYDSIMHYNSMAFSKNGMETIMARTGGVRIGDNLKLSRTDITKLNLLYNCYYKIPSMMRLLPWRFGTRGFWPQDRFEDDIIGMDFYDAYRSELLNERPYSRTAVKNKNLLWPNGVVAYVFDNRLGYHQRLIRQAMDRIESVSCVRFVQRTRQSDYLYIFPGDGCYSMVGKAGGKQPLSLGPGCYYFEVAEHELMHGIGFWHEHGRPDRDKYVQILMQNVDRRESSQFGKNDPMVVDTLDEDYDYRSIMHYGQKTFSANGLDTIVPRVSGVPIGIAKDLSITDIRKINKLYNCKSKEIVSTPAQLIATTPASSATTQPGKYYYSNYSMLRIINYIFG
ncbi:unnamed protein product [Soboliphyme baturini]|uniref:Metalloendopeptidase n=1 Tax=Soboliphyme baturini TaxID=241478 RepID=A0A183IC87_9BILA|nr:unnamed protein product [Soboliphyme baturini]